MNGEKLIIYEGETVAAALIASGINIFGKTVKSEKARGMYCGIGNCHECMAAIDNIPDLLACQTPVTQGCKIETTK